MRAQVPEAGVESEARGWRAWRPVAPWLAIGLAIAGLIVATNLDPARWSIPPRPAECVRNWNAADNAATRARVAGTGHAIADVSGWEAQAADLALRAHDQRGVEADRLGEVRPEVDVVALAQHLDATLCRSSR